MDKALLHTKHYNCLKRNHMCAIALVVNWTSHFKKNGMSFLKDIEKQLAIQTWVLSRHFLENELCEPVISRQSIDNIFSIAQSWVFRQNLKFWKTCICSLKMNIFPILNFQIRWMVTLINEFINIWKICKAQSIDIFQTTKAQCYKIKHKCKSHSKKQDI